MACGCVLVAIFLVISFHHDVHAAEDVGDGSPQSALVRFFGKQAQDAAQKEQLLKDIERILVTASSKPGKLLDLVHEYDDAAAQKLGTLIPSLDGAAGDIAQWSEQILQALPAMDGTQSFAMLRRMVVAALLRAWLQRRQKFAGAEEARIKQLLNEVGPPAARCAGS
jgi:hypothetical protein